MLPDVLSDRLNELSGKMLINGRMRLAERLDIAVINHATWEQTGVAGHAGQAEIDYEHGREGMLAYINFKHIRTRFDLPQGR